MSKFKEDKTEQSLLFGYNVIDFISETHLANLVDEIVERLDTKKIEEKYSELGQKSYPPKLMIKILFYAYSKGIFSSRKIATACYEVLPFMFLGRMYRPDFRTISDFRKNNIDEMGNFFVEILKYCNELGLTEFGKISIDGSKFRANASSKLTKTKSEYEKWEEQLKLQVKELTEKAEKIDIEENNKISEKNEIEKIIKSKENLIKKIELAKKDLDAMKAENEKKGNKKEPKINLTDKDSNFMKERNGVIKANYNAQISVTDNNIIVAAEVTTEANDQNQLINIIEKTEKNTDTKVEEVKADSGYGSYNNYQEIKEKNIDGYIPDKQLYNDEKNKDNIIENEYDNKNFKYNSETDEYVCPAGKVLNFEKTIEIENQRYKEYKCSACKECSNKEKCCPKEKNKIIKHNELKYLQDEMRAKLRSEEGKKIYRKRMNCAESPFGHLKKNLGFKQFSLRTKEKVNGEWKLLCAAYNIMKIHNLKRLKRA